MSNQAHNAGGTGVAGEGACVPVNMIIKIIPYILILIFASIVLAQTNEINIIPQPQSITRGNGSFTLSKKTKILAMSAESRTFGAILNDVLRRDYGFELEITDRPQTKNVIQFAVLSGSMATASGSPSEEYSLKITPEIIQISGRDRGVFYGLQSLIQLIPAKAGSEASIPVVEIQDRPRFQYRGMHLDVSRHFMPVSFVKKYIDLMSQYKFNNFHWHLTDDQGWRIEIKKYPKLTEIGSKRTETVKERNLTPYIGDGIPVEGFYTQDEIRDVVAYAKARYITVIPEIELPGHSSAALTAYPELGCKQDYKYKVQTTWGIFKEVYCPNEKTFQFLEDVLTETIALFPDSPYVHIGGDEVLKDFWKESPEVKELMARENLKDEHEVQSYFIRRMEKVINAKGKKIIGWDEILEGGLAPNATVMSWRGIKGGIDAAKAKHDVIMTPTDYAYFDYGQGDPAYEPLNIGSYVPLEKVYSFDPIPKELSADEQKYILGAQANIWTEYLKTPERVEYMAFPRMLAMAEVGWSEPANKNFADFTRRLWANLPRLDAQNVSYRIPEPGGLSNVVTGSDGKASITLTRMAGTKIYYTLDGSTPTESSSIYEKPITVELKSGDSAVLKTIVVNAKGRKSSIYAATIVNKELLAAVDPPEKRAGVSYEFVIPSGDMSPNTTKKGESKSIFLPQFAKEADLKSAFGVSFDGYVNAWVDGVYEFQVDSTWDTTLVLDGKMIINESGTKDRTVKSTVVPLKAGWHRVSLRYNHRGGDAAFRVRYGIKGQGLRQINGGELVH